MTDRAPGIALKEWGVAVRAMEAGYQDVIFRKGGIQEPEGDFQLAHNEFYLYPAREHQKPEFIKNEFQPLLEQTQVDTSGQQVKIRSRAKVISYNLINTFEESVPYAKRHIWTDDFIKMRLGYKPDRPLFVVQLKIELLDIPFEFIESTEQAGCRSWVNVT